MDPLSITTGVLSLIGVCWKVGTQLRTFYQDSKTVNETVSGILHDVDNLTGVLQSMRDTFQSVPEHAGGHIGTHWENIRQSLSDGQSTLQVLHDLVITVNKEVAFLDGPRKLVRLKSAETRIGAFRKQVQAFRDALQLSMQTVILWNQVSIQDATVRILPSLGDIQRDIRRIALELNSRIQILEATAADASADEEDDKLIEIKTISNLRNCVRSSASIVSSASTILGRDQETDGSTRYYGSEFGDVFEFEPSESTLAWLSSSAVASLTIESQATTIRSDPSNTMPVADKMVLLPLPSVATPLAAELSDSDSDLDAELAVGLYQKGQKKFSSRDYEGALKLLRNCFSRISGQPGVIKSARRTRVSPPDVLSLLCDTCMRLGKWDEAQSVIMDKISLSPHGIESKDQAVLADISTLVTILYQKKDFVQGHLYARRALRGYRKLGPSGRDGVERILILLVEICRSAGSPDEEEAYSVMLENVLESKVQPEPSFVIDHNTKSEEAVSELEGSTSQSEAEAGMRNSEQGEGSAGPKVTEGSHHEMALTSQERLPSLLQDPTVEWIHTSQDAGLPAPIGTETSVRGSDYRDEYALSRSTLKSAAAEGNVSQQLTRHFNPGEKRIVQKKLVIVGDGACGKTLLLAHQSMGHVPPNFGGGLGNGITFMWDSYATKVELDNTIVNLTMWDTQGQEDYDRMRPLGYPGTDIVLILFSLESPDSLDNVQEKWISEILHFLPNVPIILVGNQKDRASDPRVIDELKKTSQHTVTYEEGEDIRRKIGATAYVECSAWTGEGMKELFETAAKISLMVGPRKQTGIFRRLFRRRN